MRNTILATLLGPSDAGKTAICEKLAGPLKKFALEKRTGVTLKTGYKSFLQGDKTIYVLDNPGHESFSIEGLRNLDLADLAIYVVDGVLERGTAPYLRAQEHFRKTRSVLKAMGVPAVVCLNKADASNQEEMVSLYKDYGGENSPMEIIPTSTKTSKGLIHLKNFLKEHSPRDILHPKGVAARIIKSFNVNPFNVKLPKIFGGVLGCYRYQDLTEKSYNHTNCFSQNLSRLKVVNLEDHNQVISTIETLMDPSLARNDHQKGTLILSEDFDHTRMSNLSQNLLLDLAYQAETYNKGDKLCLLLLGQALHLVVKKTAKKKIWAVREKSKSNAAYLPLGVPAVLLGVEGKSYTIGGVCKDLSFTNL